MTIKTTLTQYMSLTKPGMIMGNLIAAAAGFFLAAKGQIDWLLLFISLSSVALIIGSACTFNNIIDRDIDRLMERTRNRVLVKGIIPVGYALAFGTTLGLSGFLLMYFFTTAIALLMGLIGFGVYVGLYSLYFKRRSVYGTAVGSISGACPPVMGYCSVTGTFDMGALLLLGIFCIWQIPHSYAIAIYRFNDYRLANIPVLPLRNGIKATRKHITLHIIAFTLVCLLLTQQHYVGIVYAISMTVLGVYWIYITVMEYREGKQREWGKKLFIFSIITICCFSMLISFDFVPEKTVLASLF
ncbi:MAG: heme o synthase [Pseudomonadota bacterium]